jgi:hypothetical protein
LAEKDAKVMELERKLVEREQGAKVASRGQSQGGGEINDTLASIPSASEQERKEICTLPTNEGEGVSTEERIGLLTVEGGCLPPSEEVRSKMIQIDSLTEAVRVLKELLTELEKVAEKKERLNSEALTLEKRLGSEALALEKRRSSEALTAVLNEMQTRAHKLNEEMQTRGDKLREAAMAKGMVSQSRIS